MLHDFIFPITQPILSENQVLNDQLIHSRSNPVYCMQYCNLSRKSIYIRNSDFLFPRNSDGSSGKRKYCRWPSSAIIRWSSRPSLYNRRWCRRPSLALIRWCIRPSLGNRRWCSRPSLENGIGIASDRI